MRRRDQDEPLHALAIGEDALVMTASHLAGLHRGLLFFLVLTIVALLPALVWGGSEGKPWTDPDPSLQALKAVRPQAHLHLTIVPRPASRLIALKAAPDAAWE